MSAVATKPQLGVVYGNIPVHPSAIAPAAQLGLDFYDEAEAAEFSGDAVDAHSKMPRWVPALDTWWPKEALRELGLKKAAKGRQVLVVTVDVDQHVDDISGLMLCYVLHNDGLTFRQGKGKCTPVAGDWFLFDDRQKHGVKAANGRSVFVGWTAPLTEID